MRVRHSLSTLLAVSITVTVVSAEIDEAASAYKRGHYKTALAELKTLADMGNPLTQYSLALMHENGQGTSVNFGQALHWYTQAAEKGDG